MKLILTFFLLFGPFLKVGLAQTEKPKTVLKGAPSTQKLAKAKTTTTRLLTVFQCFSRCFSNFLKNNSFLNRLPGNHILIIFLH